MDRDPCPLVERVLASLSVRGSTWRGVVRSAVDEIGRHLDASVARLYLLDPSGTGLRQAGGWELSATIGLRTEDRLDPRPLERNEALPGRALAEEARVQTLDLKAESASGRDPRRHPEGVRAGAAFPLMAGGVTHGVLEFGFPDPASLDPARLSEVEPAVRVLGEGLRRLQSEERLDQVADGSFVMVLRKAVTDEPRATAPAIPGRPTVASLLDRFPVAYANAPARRLTGYLDGDLDGLHLGSLMGPETDPKTANRILAALETGRTQAADFVAYRKDGTSFPLRLELAPIPSGRGGPTHFLAITPEAAFSESARPHRGESDPLTKLGNRVLLDDSLRRAFERAERNRGYRFAVLFIDLDNFKTINDSFGHVVGDQVLVAVARQLEAVVRPGDLVARFGGDEFVILLEVVGGVHDLLAVAERITERLRRPIRIPEIELGVAASIGIALSDRSHRSVEEVLKEADAAMYLAKQEGGGRYRIFDLTLQEAAMSTQRTRTALRSSLERGEFRLHYQPVMDLASGRVAGLEALLRWNHPERGVLPAGEFIADAEEMGLILPIGRWVIEEACHQIQRWREELPADRALRVSVNVSTRELMDPSLPAWLEGTLAATKVDPSWLRFEIPEGFLSRAGQDAAALLQPLLDLGIRIGIGDFGRGYSPLGLLNEIPVDVLKVDRHFVETLAEDGDAQGEGNARALRSILALAQSLGIDVAASGVETGRQEEILRELAYPYAQGNRFSEPLDAARAALLLQRAWGARSGSRPS